MRRAQALEWDENGEVAALRRQIGRGLREVFLAAGDDPAATRPLWTLFSRGDPLPREAALSALGAPLLHSAVDGGVLVEFEIDDERWVRAQVCVLTAPVAGRGVLVAADFPWHEDDRDYVGGPGNATNTLLEVVAALAPGPGPAVDVGTGSGAVAVWLRSRFTSVTATDVHPRALAFAELTAALNGTEIELRQTDFVDGLGADAALLACNPPFVIGADAPTIFRDASSELANPAALAARLRDRLRPDGYAVLLANWPYRADGADARAVLAAELDQVADSACDVLLLERAVTTPDEYAAAWADDPDEQRAWADRLRDAGVAAIGSGLIVVATAATDDDEAGHVDVGAAHAAGDEPVGPAVGAWARRVRALRAYDGDLGALVVRAGAAERSEHDGIDVLRAVGPLGLAVHGPSAQIRQVAEPLLTHCARPQRIADAVAAVPMTRTLGRSAVFALVRALVRTGLLVPCEVAETAGNKLPSETLH